MCVFFVKFFYRKLERRGLLPASDQSSLQNAFTFWAGAQKDKKITSEFAKYDTLWGFWFKKCVLNFRFCGGWNHNKYSLGFLPGPPCWESITAQTRSDLNMKSIELIESRPLSVPFLFRTPAWLMEFYFEVVNWIFPTANLNPPYPSSERKLDAKSHLERRWRQRERCRRWTPTPTSCPGASAPARSSRRARPPGSTPWMGIIIDNK